MRVGVNALYLIPGGVGGTEIYLRNLLHAIAKIDRVNEYVVFTNRETGAALVPAGFEHDPQPVNAANRPARLIWEQTRLPLAASRLALDCLLNPGFTAPAFPPCAQVTIFHDLQHKRYPEHFRWFDLPFWNLFLAIAARRSDLLLADSEATAADLQRWYPGRPVRVAPLGIEDEFFQMQWQPDRAKPYLLCVSTLHPHKNLERLIRVFGRLREEQPELRLVITGLRGFHTAVLEKLISTLSLGPAVELTGWIERAKVYELYRRASGFVFPSTFEGFGLPLIEAMAAGIPTACSNIEPLRSHAAGTVLLFDPVDEDGMLDCMRRLATHDMSAARRRAAEFSMDAAAQRVIDALVTAVDLRAGSSRPSSHRDT